MNAVLLISLALVLVPLATSTTSLVRCRVRALANCDRTKKVCLRFSRTNLCELFRNECQQKLANCNNNGGLTQAFYEKANLKYCKGLSMNQRLPCASI
ncbi:uncharacterized protein LOC127565456 [Drosophila albomicans]|uniref:Uncharacterized protein LOC127565456 n=1 Tax=Drosophila albomicans TaxID=7291 RepID=A0A9C6SQ15_DROAB|nr:uncharacterized protein LOC127565456 [Drosophila albomicans]